MRQDHRRLFRKARAARRRGFTLTELLVVLVILGLLVALVTPNVIRYVGQARMQSAAAQVEGFSTALDLYRLSAGRYPDAAAGLEALVTAPSGASGWAGPYLRGGRVPEDPWGEPYIYERPSADCFILRSYGRDGRPGGEGEDADIVASSC